MKIIVTDINGTPHELLEGVEPDFKILAKCIGGVGTRYFAMASNDGDLFDPLDLSININKQDRARGSMFWRLKACSQECYLQYTVFLRSKNRTPYLLAQRRFLND